jgi:hypothetical protein
VVERSNPHATGGGGGGAPIRLGGSGLRRSAAGDQDQPSSQHNTPIHARPAAWHGESGCAPYDPTPIIHEKGE